MIEDTKKESSERKDTERCQQAERDKGGVVGSEDMAHLPLKEKQNPTAVFNHSDWNLLSLNCDFLSGEILL